MLIVRCIATPGTGRGPPIWWQWFTARLNNKLLVRSETNEKGQIEEHNLPAKHDFARVTSLFTHSCVMQRAQNNSVWQVI